MNEQLRQIAHRIVELREILEVDAASVARGIGMPLEEYLSYESGEADIPISALYAVSGFLGVDPTELMTGEAPRMADYTIVRGGKGVDIERYPGYSFSALAYNFIGRQMDPMLVDLAPSEHPPKLVRHGGQEFNYVLEGSLIITIGAREFTLHAGDSIYFDPSIWHGQRAIDRPVRFITIINE